MGRPGLAAGRGSEGLGWTGRPRVGRGEEGGELEIWHRALERGRREGAGKLEISKGGGGRERGEEQGRALRIGELAPERGEVVERLGRAEGGSVGREARSARGSGRGQERGAVGIPRRADRTLPGT